MCDWEGCTTGTIGLPNPNQWSVAKTSGFLHPYIYRYTDRDTSPGRESSRSGGPSRFSFQVVATGNHAIFGADGVLAKHNIISNQATGQRVPDTAGGKTKKEVKTLLKVLKVKLDWPKSSAQLPAPSGTHRAQHLHFSRTIHASALLKWWALQSSIPLGSRTRRFMNSELFE